ncbi:hypothetical protein AVEN_260636-1 [Araneus ventricosus]|uniref:DUF4371 domain-containing protein n=1 Tax=Araneus ventricosus TaxID=182803 RepID=A0A4Y2PV99_ARAVE|nr:hypothetical protein AVEN_260636-1 [Araneus ventricosus]
MGEYAVKAHMQGVKHASLLEAKLSTARPIEFFCKATESAVKEASNNSASTSSTSDSSSITSFVTRKSALDAEILWALKCVKSHYSFNSCQGNGELFRKMFPDSIIAKQFALGERKCSYLIVLGLAPYFKTKLTKNLENSEFFTLLFDETLNNSNQKKQLDVHVRYWEPYDNKMVTTYFGSALLGHSTAKDILTEFYDIIGSSSLPKLLQISMDGPSVNWSFYKTLQEDVQKQFSSNFANVGSWAPYS